MNQNVKASLRRAESIMNLVGCNAYGWAVAQKKNKLEEESNYWAESSMDKDRNVTIYIRGKYSGMLYSYGTAKPYTYKVGDIERTEWQDIDWIREF